MWITLNRSPPGISKFLLDIYIVLFDHFFYRNCIGKQFAMNELKVAIAMTIHRFHISADPDRVPKMMSRLVLRSFDGIYLKFTPVKSPI